MKKWLFGVAIIAIILAMVVNMTKLNDKPEKLIESVIIKMFEHEYEEISLLESEELAKHNRDKLNELKELFTEEMFTKINYNLINITAIDTIKQLKCSTSVTDIEYDVREIDSTYVIYFTIHLNLNYDDVEDAEKIALTGVGTIVTKVEDYYIEELQINTKKIKVLLDKRKSTG